MENTASILQKTRREEIQQLIAKYKFLIDQIFKEVSKDIPTFTAISIKNDKDESTHQISAEEQLYNYLLMREKMIDHADRMLNKINMLELELNAPELFKKLSEPEEKKEEVKQAKAPRNHAKAIAEKKE